MFLQLYKCNQFTNKGKQQTVNIKAYLGFHYPEPAWQWEQIFQNQRDHIKEQATSDSPPKELYHNFFSQLR